MSTHQSPDPQAIYRAEWLHAHNAPKEWLIMTTGELDGLKHATAALRAENERLRELLEGAMERSRTNSRLHEAAEADLVALRAENEKLRAELVTAQIAREFADAATENLRKYCREREAELTALRRDRQAIIALAASYRHSATVQHNINLGHDKWMLECAEDIDAAMQEGQP